MDGAVAPDGDGTPADRSGSLWAGSVRTLPHDVHTLLLCV